MVNTLYAGRANSPATTLVTGISAGDTSATLTDSTVLPAAPNICTFGTGEDAETVSYTGNAGNVISGLTRAIDNDGTHGIAKAWGAGTVVSREHTNYDWQGVIDRMTTGIYPVASKTGAGISIYVDKAAVGAGTGVDWTNAFTTLPLAIASLPTILENAVTIYIRKGSTPYAEATVIQQISGKGSVVIQGEYYWNGNCAAAGTPAVNKFRMTAADGANIATGDLVLVTNGTGANDTNTHYIWGTVTGATYISGTTWEITVSGSADWGANIGATDYYTIVKTIVSGATTINSSGSVSLRGLSCTGSITINAGSTITDLTCMFAVSTSPVYLDNSSKVMATRNCYFETNAAGGSCFLVTGGSSGGANNGAATASVFNAGAATTAAVWVATESSADFRYNFIKSASAGIYVSANAITVAVGNMLISGMPTGIYLTQNGRVYALSNINKATLPYGGDFNWIPWTPTLTWTTGTPASVTTIARYTKIGNVVNFNVDILSADSNACTNLTITLPVTPINNGNRIACASIERAGAGGTTYSDPLAYILADGSNNKINFYAFTTATDNQAIGIYVSGSYEVAM